MKILEATRTMQGTQGTRAMRTMRTIRALPPRCAALAALGLALLLGACGGGGDDPAALAPPPAAQSAAQSAAPAAPPQLAAAASPPPARLAAVGVASLAPLDVDLLLNWGERNFPHFFPGHQNNLEFGPYTYRHYPETGNYVGVAGDDVVILGAFTDWVILRVGSREAFRCQVSPADCVSSNYARAGWVAQLSNLAHGVQGTVTIVDERTLRITGFHYDGGGPSVYAYLGSSNTNAAFLAGRIIGPRLNRPGQPYVDATLELQLPEGQTLDDYAALSIWCADFRVNFGSGSFAPPAPSAR